MSEADAAEHAREDGWIVAEDAGRGWRRLVPSPKPVEIIQLPSIRTLLDSGAVVIAVGGGGIPVARYADGTLHGRNAVIDKDAASSLLARQLGASILIFSTSVDRAALHFDTPDQPRQHAAQDRERNKLPGSRRREGHHHSTPSTRRCLARVVRHTYCAGLIYQADMQNKEMPNKEIYMNGYRCFACALEQTVDFAGLSCPACGGNLDITYDYAEAAQEIAASFVTGSRDMFRYQPLLPVNSTAMPFPLRVGGTPLYKASGLGKKAGLHHLYLKDDSRNPSASLKDRASAVVVRRAVDTGAEVISAASTGNAGSSLACLAAAVGLQSVIFVPQNAPVAKLTQALSFGAKVLAVRGNYDDAFELCQTASEEFGWFNRSTGLNPFTREGKKTCAFEIWEDLDGQVPDRIVVPTGDGNILSGIWKGWCDLKAVGLIDRLPKMDCAQSELSNAINRTVERIRGKPDLISDWSQVTVDKVHATTVADSISVDQPRDGLAAVQAIIQSGGQTITVPDEEILTAIGEIAESTGVFCEPAAAASWAAAKQLARDHMSEMDELIVCIISGSGLKDVASAAKVTIPPLVINPSIEDVRDALNP
jgi:threonine synthase